MTPRSPVTLSNENVPSRFQPSVDSRPAASGRQQPAHAPGWRSSLLTEGGLIALREQRP
jgi:hypothetical protein